MILSKTQAKKIYDELYSLYEKKLNVNIFTSMNLLLIQYSNGDGSINYSHPKNPSLDDDVKLFLRGGFKLIDIIKMYEKTSFIVNKDHKKTNIIAHDVMFEYMDFERAIEVIAEEAKQNE